MNPSLSIGFSPCPNDTFIFHALVHGLVPMNGLAFREHLADVEALNRLARAERLDVTKVSYHAVGHLRDRYALLRSGGALGRGCGPLLVARSAIDPRDLLGKRIAIPGQWTTAFLLLRLFDPDLGASAIEMPFHEIMHSVAAGRVDAGLIIHESRFTYPSFGLVSLLDLGSWWEEETGLPIPLGGIMARRDLGSETIRTIESLVSASARYALDHPEASRAYVRAHAQEMDEEVMRRHIELYVNDFSVDLGIEGVKAVEVLLERAETSGIIPKVQTPLFA